MNPAKEPDRYRVYTLQAPSRRQINMKEGAQIDLAVMLGQIDGKLDLLVTQDLDGRISSIESWQNRVTGGAGVILFLASIWELLRYVKILH